MSYLPAPSYNAAYDVVDAEKTINAGYAAIVENHLDRITAASVALEGMRGLANIDPEIGVKRQGNKVLLSASDRLVAEYPAPPETDVRGWARLTVTFALEARTVSPTVKEAEAEKIYEAVFDATLSKLDMFSRYAGAREARDLDASRNGFGGLGIKFDMVDGEPKIIEVTPDTPAARVGLRVGDIIAEADGEPLAGLSRTEISHKLRGEVSTDLAMLIRRDGGQLVPISLQRAFIVPQTVATTLHDGIAAFKITSFNQRTAASLTQGLKTARGQLGPAMKGVILDLRGNPGGLLDQAVQMADLFIADGTIVTTKGRHPRASQSYDARSGDPGEDLAVVVLVDGKSASAAEILAGALEDSGRAVVIGTNSFGKGTVQTVIKLPNGGEMALTWARFHTPSGYALHGLGVLPTICTADGKATVAGLMSGVTRSSGPVAAVAGSLAQWRSVRLDEGERRKALRGLCPGVKHGEGTVDMELAERLLSDRAAFAHALALSTPRGGSATAGALPPRSSSAFGLH